MAQVKGLHDPIVYLTHGHRVPCSPDAGKGMSTRERLQRIEAKVRQMEQALGLDNPQVGVFQDTHSTRFIACH